MRLQLSLFAPLLLCLNCGGNNDVGLVTSLAADARVDGAMTTSTIDATDEALSDSDLTGEVETAGHGDVESPDTKPEGWYEFCAGNWCRGQCFKNDAGMEECRCFDLVGGCGPTTVCCSASVCVASCPGHS